MAQRLEAALRRPSGNPAADRVPPDRAPPDRAPPVAPEGPSNRGPAPRPPAPASEPTPVAAAPAESETRPQDDAPQFKNLEDEMASLLGRPKTPS
jgi:hypothetical protein